MKITQVTSKSDLQTAILPYSDWYEFRGVTSRPFNGLTQVLLDFLAEYILTFSGSKQCPTHGVVLVPTAVGVCPLVQQQDNWWQKLPWERRALVL